MRLASNILQIPTPTPIPRAQKWGADVVRRNQRTLLDLSQGAPGTPPPLVLREAISKAALDPVNSGYGPILGLPSLRESMAKEMKVVYGERADVLTEDIGFTTGCNMAFVAAIMTVAQQGDEVILPVPWYFNQQMTLDMLGIDTVPLLLRPEKGFIPSVEDCEALITPRTRAIVLVSPNNPTGAIYPPNLLDDFGRLAAKHDIALILDETYRDFIMTNEPPHSLFDPTPDGWEWRKHFIHLFSFSKSYAIPGHRLGCIVSSPQVLEHIGVALDSLQICPGRPIQAALPSLLPSLRDTFIKDTAKALDARHKLFKSLLPPSWVVGSSGGYFAFVKHPFKGVGSEEFCEKLAREVGVVMLPAAFFTPSDDTRYQSWLRVAVANVDDEKITLAAERLKEFEQKYGHGWSTQRRIQNKL